MIEEDQSRFLMEYLQVFRRLNLALSNCDFPSFYFKPKQIECFEYLLEGSDVIAVLIFDLI